MGNGEKQKTYSVHYSHCVICGKPFTHKRVGAMYCSAKCKVESYRRRNGKSDPLQKRGYIYLLQSDIGLYKIGKSKNPQRRLSDLERELNLNIQLIHEFLCDDDHRAEKFLHLKYDNKRLGGEWFALSDVNAEWICSINSDQELYEP